MTIQKYKNKWQRCLFIGLTLLLFMIFGGSTSTAQLEATTYIVNDLGDAGDFNPGDSTCETALGNGVCTLRAAVEESNGSISSPDTITFSIPAGSTITLVNGELELSDDVTIDGSTATSLTVNGNNTSRVFHVTATVSATITDLLISNGGGVNDGAGIYNAGVLVLTNAVVASNTALGSVPGAGGGGIFNANVGDLTLNDTNVTNNTAIVPLGNGGGIHNDGTLTVNGGTITDNQAARAGGGLENNGGTVTFNNVTLDGNTTGINGGGLHISGTGTVTINGGAVSGNAAGEEGGGLWNSATGSLTVNGTLVKNNIASGALPTNGGGGLFNDGGLMSVDQAVIIDNSANGASGSGGGIFNNVGGTLDAVRTVIRGNDSIRAGGGIEDNAGSSVLLDRVTLDGNTTGASPGNGGGLHITGAGTVMVVNSTVSNNIASAEGGGLWNSAVGTLTVDKSTVNGNEGNGIGVDQGGGGLFNDGGTLMVTNSTLSGNMAPMGGGGVLNANGNSTLIHVTAYENVSTSGAGGVMQLFGSVTLMNSIVAHDVATGDDCAGTITVPPGIPNLASDITCNATIVTTNPMLGTLVNNGGSTLTHALLVGSPASSAGNNATCQLPAIDEDDQRSFTRPADGPNCDLGAYELGIDPFLYLPIHFKP